MVGIKPTMKPTINQCNYVLGTQLLFLKDNKTTLQQVQIYGYKQKHAMIMTLVTQSLLDLRAFWCFMHLH